MKKNDIALLIIIVAVSVGIAYFAGRAIIGHLKPADATVEVVEVISADITKPDPAVFNSDAINPSIPIKIGDSTNQQPFGQ